MASLDYLWPDRRVGQLQPPEDTIEFNFTTEQAVISTLINSASTPKHQLKPGQAPSTRKRKRLEVPKMPALPEQFTIFPEDYGESVFITPTAILPRSYMNLDWVNTKPHARLFRADIPALDYQDVVMIAKYDNSLQLAGIQRLGFPGGQTYTIFRLSNAIKLKYVRGLVAQLKKDYDDWIRPEELDETSESDTKEWWEPASLGDDILVNALKNVNVTPSQSQLTMNCLLRATKNLDIKKAKATPSQKGDTLSAQLPAKPQDTAHEDCLSQLVQQYYSLLYNSKASLQYFPKTTLSRARNIFATNGTSPASRLDLLLFLEGLIIPVDDCDQKYRNGLRTIARAKRDKITTNDKISDNELESSITPPECLRDGELKYILKWLGSTSADDMPVFTIEQEDAHIQKCSMELRSRETELQIILLLEILAMKEKLSDDKNKEYLKLKKSTERKQKKLAKEQGKPLKKDRKKKVNPADVLDVLIDRLCIWHSIGFSDESEDSKQETSKQKDQKDYLRHFCVEIVVAYYSPRIPSICDEIVRKCTGKMMKPSKKEQPTKANTPSNKENEPTKQVSEQVSDKPIEGSTLSAPTLLKPPILSRSLTAPAKSQHFDTSDSPFAASFHAESQDLSFEIAAHVSQEKEVMKTSFRAGITNTKKTVDNRVVEVPKIRNKRQKTGDMKDPQLQDAIRNISKPNRHALAEEMMSASAQRMKISGRKPKKTIRNPHATAVQVAATPRKNFRTSKILDKSADIPDLIAEEKEFIPSSGQFVPQSSIKTGKRKSIDMEEIEATPSKRPQMDKPRMPLHQQDLHQLNFLPSSPLCVSATPVQMKRSLTDSFKVPASRPNIFMANTPSNPFKTSKETTSLGRGFMNSISETPTKPGISSKLRSLLPIDAEEEVIASSPLQRPKPGTPATRRLISRNLEDEFDDAGPSIYEQLGWD